MVSAGLVIVVGHTELANLFQCSLVSIGVHQTAPPLDDKQQFPPLQPSAATTSVPDQSYSSQPPPTSVPDQSHSSQPPPTASASSQALVVAETVDGFDDEMSVSGLLEEGQRNIVEGLSILEEVEQNSNERKQPKKRRKPLDENEEQQVAIVPHSAPGDPVMSLPPMTKQTIWTNQRTLERLLSLPTFSINAIV